MPKLDVVQAIVVGCGGSKEDVDGFTRAWQRLNSATFGGHLTCIEPLAAPVAVAKLELVPSG